MTHSYLAKLTLFQKILLTVPVTITLLNFLSLVVVTTFHMVKLPSLPYLLTITLCLALG